MGEIRAIEWGKSEVSSLKTRMSRMRDRREWEIIGNEKILMKNFFIGAFCDIKLPSMLSNTSEYVRSRFLFVRLERRFFSFCG